MTVPSSLVDASSGNRAEITRYGQLVVAPVDYSSSISTQLLSANTAYNLLHPAMGQGIVVTDIIITGARSVGANGAEVAIYASEVEDTLVADLDILTVDIIKQTVTPLIGLNLLVPEGLFINAKTDDDDVYITLMYYRVPKG